jgi:hypothetical protein
MPSPTQHSNQKRQTSLYRLPSLRPRPPKALNFKLFFSFINNRVSGSGVDSKNSQKEVPAPSSKSFAESAERSTGGP